MTSHRLSLVFLTLVLSGQAVRGESSSSSISWKTHYGNAKRVAEATKRPLLVVIEDSKRVDSRIDEKTLDGTSRAKLIRQDFELVRVDANTDYGKRVAQAFGVQQFPYTAVTDGGSKRIVFRKTGHMSASDWTLALAKSAQANAKVAVTTSPAERIVHQVQPAHSEVVIYEQPSQPVYPVISQPLQASPIINGDFFAPNGFYQMPAEQCFT